LKGKKYSYNKKGMREFQKAKKKKHIMGKKNGGLVKYRGGGVVKNKSDMPMEQDRVMKKYAAGGMLDTDKKDMQKMAKMK